jgi:hypothetical protein
MFSCAYSPAGAVLDAAWGGVLLVACELVHTAAPPAPDSTKPPPMRTVVPATFELALQLACPADRIASTGVHSEPAGDLNIRSGR